MNITEPLAAGALLRPGFGRSWRDRSERGASAVEYGLLIAGIAAIIAVAVFAFGGGSHGIYQDSCHTIFEDTSTGSCG